MTQSKANSGKLSLTSVAAACGALLGIVAAIAGIAGHFATWRQQLFPKLPYEFVETHAQVVPSNLKYHYDSEGLGKRES